MGSRHWSLMVALVGLGLLALGVGAGAQVPSVLNYQGRVATSSGAAVGDDLYPMSFGLYRQLSGGNPLWSESRSVQLSGGVYNVSLGAGVPIPATAFTDSGTAYLQVIFNGDTLSPRQLVNSEGYAFSSGQAQTLKTYVTDTISEKTTGAGVTVDGLLIKDGGLPNFAQDSLYRQAVINGNFDVWQRGTSFVNPSGAVPARCADRWQAFRDAYATGLTASRQDANLNGSQYCLRMQRAAANTGTLGIFLEYDWETCDAVKFRGQYVTVSFYARAGANFSSPSAVLNAAFITGTGVDESNRHGYTGAVWAKSQDNTLTTSWQKYVMSTDAPLATSVNEFAIEFVYNPVGTAGANDYFELAQVQLNAGQNALPFQPRTFDQELLACQRYFEKSYDYATAPGTPNIWGMRFMTGVLISTNGYESAPVYFKVRKRVQPGVITYDYPGTAGKITTTAINGSWTNGVNPTLENVCEVGFVNTLGADGTRSGQTFNWTADAEW